MEKDQVTTDKNKNTNTTEPEETSEERYERISKKYLPQSEVEKESKAVLSGSYF